MRTLEQEIDRLAAMGVIRMSDLADCPYRYIDAQGQPRTASPLGTLKALVHESQLDEIVCELSNRGQQTNG